MVEKRFTRVGTVPVFKFSVTTILKVKENLKSNVVKLPGCSENLMRVCRFINTLSPLFIILV